jgi:hypothetical protein
MKYTVTEDQMMEFAKKLYAEGFGGFMDLCDSVCQKMVVEFLEGKKNETSTQLNLPSPHVTVTTGWYGNPEQSQIRLLGSDVFSIGDIISPNNLPNDSQER